MMIRTKHIAILPAADDRVVPRLMRIQNGAKYLSATTWQVEPFCGKSSSSPLCTGAAVPALPTVALSAAPYDDQVTILAER
jgi:hypothetical protein